MSKTKMTPPWVTHLNKLKALLEDDPYILSVEAESDSPREDGIYTIRIKSANESQAEALQKILIEPTFGNVQVEIIVDYITFNDDDDDEIYKLERDFVNAFDKNPYVDAIQILKTGLFGESLFIESNWKALQFPNDNFNSPYGISSFLPEIILKDVCESYPAVHFSTSLKDEYNI